MSIDALPRVSTAQSALESPVRTVELPQFDLTTAFQSGGVYDVAHIYARWCTECAHHNPCDPHRTAMESAYLSRFAAQQGLRVDEQPQAVEPVRSSPAWDAFGSRIQLFAAIAHDGHACSDLIRH